jgi:hypothetical protein
MAHERFRRGLPPRRKGWVPTGTWRKIKIISYSGSTSSSLKMLLLKFIFGPMFHLWAESVAGAPSTRRSLMCCLSSSIATPLAAAVRHTFRWKTIILLTKHKNNFSQNYCGVRLSYFSIMKQYFLSQHFSIHQRKPNSSARERGVSGTRIQRHTLQNLAA